MGTSTNNPTSANALNVNANYMYTELTFSSKGLHFCNLNMQHILPKTEEIRVMMANNKCPDILGLCETFLDPNIMDSKVATDG